MTGVILRCPNCGTSKATPGECDACHEAQVRYYCTNHKPGHWLDASVCPQCGAKFGDPVRPAARPIPPAAPPRPRTTVTSAAPSRVDPPPSPPRTSAKPWGRRERERSPDPDLVASDESTSVRDIRTARMLEILRAASRVGRMSRGATYTTPGGPTGWGIAGRLPDALRDPRDVPAHQLFSDAVACRWLPVPDAGALLVLRRYIRDGRSCPIIRATSRPGRHVASPRQCVRIARWVPAVRSATSSRHRRFRRNRLPATETVRS